MFATKCLRQASAAAAHAERTPLIKFIGKRSIPSSIDHTPQAHPASPSHELPADFASSQTSSSTSFSSYRQSAQQHGPLGRSKAADGTLGSSSGHSLGPVTPAKGEFFDRSELPARFRTQPIDLSEIDAIETGGATLVC
ncbi:related to mitochondrial ribosomal protein [Rhynchosporium agropyri]|uniref:Related to mitochondrial ribosomal protein n=1 Tax=Rhynchosporium agropyri TaxID=914238 RepID=A0A1E1LJI0_9HELO|nr:related to mitochondrial ribosomal protein [Rhynchosporium agropyri]